MNQARYNIWVIGTTVAIISLLYFFVVNDNSGMWEHETNVISIEQSNDISSNMSPIYLGYKKTIKRFILPMYATGNGYVLCTGAHNNHCPINKADLETLYEQGIFTKPLQDYSDNSSGVLWGFHLLALCLMIIGYNFLDTRRRR